VLAMPARSKAWGTRPQQSIITPKPFRINDLVSVAVSTSEGNHTESMTYEQPAIATPSYARRRARWQTCARRSPTVHSGEPGASQFGLDSTHREELERLMAKDMLNLHDVKGFLKSKEKPDPGFSPIRLEH
jgi:hypothetical protein